MERLTKMVLEMRKNRVFFLFSSLPYYFLSCYKRAFKCVPKYNGLSLSRLPSISNFSLYQTNFPVPWTIFSLYLEHLHIRIWFSNCRINLNLNQNENFDRKWKQNLFFVLSVVKTKMSVKRKVNTKTLKERCKA